MDKKWGGGKYQEFPSKKLSLTVPKNFVGQTCCAVFQKFPVAKNFMDKAGGVSRSSVEKIFSHSSENFRSGIFYCFIIFRYRNMLGIKERGENGSIKIFRRKIFLSHSRKNS